MRNAFRFMDSEREQARAYLDDIIVFAMSPCEKFCPVLTALK